mgnify:CR=1 FL=1
MLFQALQKVFRKPLYVFIALITSAVMFVFATWLPNFRLIASVIGSSDASFSQKLGIPISLFGSISTNFTTLSALYTIAIAILFGVSLAMVVYFMRRKISEVRQSGTVAGFVGVASGVLGIGCAACGSLILTSGLALFGASGVLAFLPLAGGEFGILGVILLLVSIYFTAKQIENPAVCKI